MSLKHASRIQTGFVYFEFYTRVDTIIVTEIELFIEESLYESLIIYRQLDIPDLLENNSPLQTRYFKSEKRNPVEVGVEIVENLFLSGTMQHLAPVEPSFSGFLIPFIELGKFVTHLYINTSQDIVENKSTFDILTDFATIIGFIIPLADKTIRVLYADKMRSNKKAPTVTISIGDISVSVTDEDLEDAEHAATNIARKLLKKHPDARPSKQLRIKGKLSHAPILQGKSRKNRNR